MLGNVEPLGQFSSRTITLVMWRLMAAERSVSLMDGQVEQLRSPSQSKELALSAQGNEALDLSL